VGVFSLLVACGLGLPLPEDVSLITGGYLAATRLHELMPLAPGALPPPEIPFWQVMLLEKAFWLMLLTGLSGILIGDSIIYKAGRDYGDALLDTRMGRHIPRDRVATVRRLFARHGSKMIMVARFLPGIRAVTFFVAGSSRVRYRVFFAYDGLAAMVSAPVWVCLGFWAGQVHALKKVKHWASEFQMSLLAAVAIVGLVALCVWLVRRHRGQGPAPERATADGIAKVRPPSVDEVAEPRAGVISAAEAPTRPEPWRG
jgi:membrane protein DedA with SNARE-associated domain